MLSENAVRQSTRTWLTGVRVALLLAVREPDVTLLLGQGVNPKFVQELLRHADISLTLNVFSHVLPGMGDAATGAIDDALE
jgi:hypothetical protein